MVNGKINEQGKPYLWAQRLAGLDFNGVVKSTPQTFINTEFVETVVSFRKKHFVREVELILVFSNRLLLPLKIGSTIVFNLLRFYIFLVSFLP